MAVVELGSTSLFGDASLVAYWKAENVNDSKASFNLTNHNSVQFNAAKFNNGFDYGASNSTKYLDIANNLGLNTYQAGIFSWTGWVNITTAPSNEDHSIFFVENNTKGQYELEYNDTSGTKALKIVLYNGSSAQLLTYTQTLTVGTWYHLAVVKNGTSVTVFVNGASLGAQTITLADASPGRPDQFAIGCNAFSPTNFARAVFDDIAVFSKALSPSEVDGLANGFPLARAGGNNAFFM